MLLNKTVRFLRNRAPVTSPWNPSNACSNGSILIKTNTQTSQSLYKNTKIMAKRKKIIYRTQFNHEYDIKKTGKKFTLPSQTIPGETLTVQEILNRAVMQGHFPDEDKQSNYLDCKLEEIDEFYRQGLDLTDLERKRQHVKDYQNKLKEYEAEVNRVQKERDVTNQVDSRLSEARAKDERNAELKPKSQILE